MNVRARLKDPDEFFYPDSNEPADLSSFWGVMEGYRRSGRDYEINWGTDVKDREGNEIYQGDIVDVFFTPTKSKNKPASEPEEGYVDYLDGCFVVLNKAGLIWDIGAGLDNGDVFALAIKGNIYDHLVP